MSCVTRMMFLLLLFVSLATAQPPQRCPRHCRCSRDDKTLEIECGRAGSYSSLQQLTADVPTDVTMLSLEKLTLTSLYLPPPELSRFPYLETLRVKNCGVLTIDDSLFGGSTSLQYLDISDNNIVNITGNTFKGLSNLKYLSFYGNKLVSIPENSFKDCTGLTKLDISSNEIESAGISTQSFKGLYQLEMLSLQGNVLGPQVRLDLTDSSSLNSVYLDKNSLQQLTNTTVTPSQSLELLSVAHNRLVEISANALQGFPLLTGLFADGNHVKTLHPDLFKGLVHMVQILFNSNPLDNLPTSLFSDVTYLEQLELADTHMTSLQPELFNGLPHITRLNLGSNFLQTIPSGFFRSMPELVSLSINDNSLTALDTDVFTGLSNLQEIYLFNNKLRNLTASSAYFEPLSSLKGLYAGGNGITNVPDGWLHGLPKLQVLALSWNGIKTMGRNVFPRTSKLEKLYLERSELADFALDSQFPDLILLQMNHNYITSLKSTAFSSMPLLEVLDVHSNQLTEIHTDLFSYNSNLKEIDLNDNELRYVDARPFFGLTLLESVDLTSNPLCLSHEEAEVLVGAVLGIRFDVQEKCDPPDTQEPSDQRPLDKQSAAELERELKKKKKMNIILTIVAAALGLLFLVFLIVTVFLCCRRTKKLSRDDNNNPKLDRPLPKVPRAYEGPYTDLTNADSQAPDYAYIPNGASADDGYIHAIS